MKEKLFTTDKTYLKPFPNYILPADSLKSFCRKWLMVDFDTNTGTDKKVDVVWGTGFNIDVCKLT